MDTIIKQIIGCDYDSTQISFVVINLHNKIKNYFEIDSKAATSEERFIELTNKLYHIIDAEDLITDAKFIVEGNIYSVNPRATLGLAQVKGMILATCIYHGIPFQVIPAKTWKMKVLGNGNSKKEDIAKWVIKKFPELKGKSQHIYDSLCIALAGNKRGDIEKSKKNTNNIRKNKTRVGKSS